MGTKVVMYMVHRKAIISSGNWFQKYGKFLRSGENSILIPPSAEVFGEETVQILLDSARRAKIGKSAWMTVHPYTWDEHADETLRLLRAAVRS
jgi:glycosyltransferase involved in cell wall biosynthesis